MILALDPGKRGALCYSLDHQTPAGLFSLAGHDVVQLYLRLQAITHLVGEGETKVAFLEQNTGYLTGLPRTGASMYTFGLSTGHAEMALAALGFALRRVRPRVWQKVAGCPQKRAGEAHSAFKGRLASFAREVTPALRARITRENADSVLILRYGLLNLLEHTGKEPILPSEQPTTDIT